MCLPYAPSRTRSALAVGTSLIVAFSTKLYALGAGKSPLADAGAISKGFASGVASLFAPPANVLSAPAGQGQEEAWLALFMGWALLDALCLVLVTQTPHAVSPSALAPLPPACAAAPCAQARCTLSRPS